MDRLKAWKLSEAGKGLSLALAGHEHGYGPSEILELMRAFQPRWRHSVSSFYGRDLFPAALEAFRLERTEAITGALRSGTVDADALSRWFVEGRARFRTRYAELMKEDSLGVHDVEELIRGNALPWKDQVTLLDVGADGRLRSDSWRPVLKRYCEGLFLLVSADRIFRKYCDETRADLKDWMERSEIIFEGTVRRYEGDVVAGATVSLSGGRFGRAESDEAGRYRLVFPFRQLALARLEAMERLQAVHERSTVAATRVYVPGLVETARLVASEDGRTRVRRTGVDLLAEPLRCRLVVKVDRGKAEGLWGQVARVQVQLAGSEPRDLPDDCRITFDRLDPGPVLVSAFGLSEGGDRLLAVGGWTVVERGKVATVSLALPDAEPVNAKAEEIPAYKEALDANKALLLDNRMERKVYLQAVGLLFREANKNFRMKEQKSQWLRKLAIDKFMDFQKHFQTISQGLVYKGNSLRVGKRLESIRGELTEQIAALPELLRKDDLAKAFDGLLDHHTSLPPAFGEGAYNFVSYYKRYIREGRENLEELKAIANLVLDEGVIRLEKASKEVRELLATYQTQYQLLRFQHEMGYETEIGGILHGDLARLARLIDRCRQVKAGGFFEAVSARLDGLERWADNRAAQLEVVAAADQSMRQEMQRYWENRGLAIRERWSALGGEATEKKLQSLEGLFALDGLLRHKGSMENGLLQSRYVRLGSFLRDGLAVYEGLGQGGKGFEARGWLPRLLSQIEPAVESCLAAGSVRTRLQELRKSYDTWLNEHVFELLDHTADKKLVAEWLTLDRYARRNQVNLEVGKFRQAHALDEGQRLGDHFSWGVRARDLQVRAARAYLVQSMARADWNETQGNDLSRHGLGLVDAMESGFASVESGCERCVALEKDLSRIWPTDEGGLRRFPLLDEDLTAENVERREKVAGLWKRALALLFDRIKARFRTGAEAASAAATSEALRKVREKGDHPYGASISPAFEGTLKQLVRRGWVSEAFNAGCVAARARFRKACVDRARALGETVSADDGDVAEEPSSLKEAIAPFDPRTWRAALSSWFKAPRPKPKPKPRPKPRVKAKPRPEVKPAAKPEAKPAAKPEAKPVAKPAAKPVAKPAVKPEAKPAAKPEAKPAARPAAKPTSKPAPKPRKRPLTLQERMIFGDDGAPDASDDDTLSDDSMYRY